MVKLLGHSLGIFFAVLKGLPVAFVVADPCYRSCVFALVRDGKGRRQGEGEERGRDRESARRSAVCSDLVFLFRHEGKQLDTLRKSQALSGGFCEYFLIFFQIRQL